MADLKHFFHLAKNVLKEKGIIAVSIKFENQTQEKLIDSELEYFAYNPQYVESVLESVGLKVVRESEVQFPGGDIGKIMLLIK